MVWDKGGTYVRVSFSLFFVQYRMNREVFGVCSFEI